MRILICNWKDLAHPAAGGAEVFTHQVARHWAGWGHQVTLFCAHVPGRPSREEVDGVRVVRGGGRFGVYRQARQFYQQEGRGRFDLVIDEVNTRPFLCPTYVDDAPVVALVHQVARELWFYELPLPVALLGRFWLEPRWLSHYRDVPVLTVSPSSRRSLKAYGLRRVRVVPEGLSLPRSLPTTAKAERPTVIFVGRLVSNKRPEHALRAFHLLRDRLPTAQLWVVGSGPLESRLRRAAGPGVRFFGRVSEEEKYILMRRAHVLVVTSVREGWGLVVDEAAVVGTPTIGYAVPGLVDSIPAAGGVLVPPSPAALADELFRRLPRLLDADARPGWTGGAVDWSSVAETVLAEAVGASPEPVGVSMT